MNTRAREKKKKLYTVIKNRSPGDLLWYCGSLHSSSRQNELLKRSANKNYLNFSGPTCDILGNNEL